VADLTVKIQTRFPQVTDRIARRIADVTAKAAFDVEGEAKTRSRVDTGNMRNSIRSESNDPFTWTVTGYAEYTIYNELGTRHMSAQPMFTPAIERVGPEYARAIERIND